MISFENYCMDKTIFSMDITNTDKEKVKDNASGKHLKKTKLKAPRISAGLADRIRKTMLQTVKNTTNSETEEIDSLEMPTAVVENKTTVQCDDNDEITDSHKEGILFVQKTDTGTQEYENNSHLCDESDILKTAESLVEDTYVEVNADNGMVKSNIGNATDMSLNLMPTLSLNEEDSFEEVKVSVDLCDIEDQESDNESVDYNAVGLRRFSIMSMSSTNIASLEDEDFVRTVEKTISELNNKVTSESYSHLNADVKVNLSQRNDPLENKNILVETASGTDDKKLGLLKVESDFVRSAEAMTTLLSQNRQVYVIPDDGNANVLDLQNKITETDDVFGQLVGTETSPHSLSRGPGEPSTQSVCRIDIHSCSTNGSSSDDDNDNDNNLQAKWRESLSLLKVPRSDSPRQAKISRQDSGVSNEPFTGEETLEEARKKMHQLLDDAFTLISPRTSFHENDIRHSPKVSPISSPIKSILEPAPSKSKISTVHLDSTKDLGQSIKHEPMYFDSGYSYKDFPLETWSPYRASDHVALISMPNKVDTKLGGPKSKTKDIARPATSKPARRPATNFDFQESKSTGHLDEKYTNSPPKPIVLRTKDLAGYVNINSDKQVKDATKTGKNSNGKYAMTSINGDVYLTGSTTSLSKPKGRGVPNGNSMEMKPVRDKAWAYPKDRDEVDVVNTVKKDTSDDLIKSLRDELQHLKGNYNVEMKPSKKERKTGGRSMTDVV